MQTIRVDGGPPINGHYSHAVVHNGIVFVAGQLGRLAGMTDAEAGDISVQMRRSLEGLGAILEAAGSGYSQLLKVNIYVADIALWPAVDEVYRQVLANHRPARTVTVSATLHFGALVEVDAIAAIR